MAVVLKTYGAQLEEVQTAITAVMNGSQKYELNGRSVERANLEWLHKREAYLSDKLNTFGDVIVGSTTTRGSAQVSFGVSE